MIHTHVAIALMSAKDYERREVAYEAALATQPDHPVTLMSLAQYRIQHHGDVEGARAYLERVDSRALAMNLGFGLAFVEGLIALERSDLTGARDVLEGAHGDLVQREPAVLYAMIRDVVATYLAEVYARLGDLETANAYYADGSPALERHDIRHVLDRVQRALADAAR